MEEITTEKAAVILNCSSRTIRNMIQRGSLKARLKRIDPNTRKGVYLIQKKEVMKLLEKQNRPR